MTTEISPRARLRDTIDTYFNLEDLRDLCQDLNLDYDNLRGETKQRQAGDLVDSMTRAGRAEELVRHIRARRPKLTPEETPVPELMPAPDHAESASSSESTALHDAYLNWLFETCSQVLLRGIDKKTARQETDARLNLSSIYTALLTTSAERQNIETHTMTSSALEEQKHTRSALAQLDQHERLVLLGDPGSGKSTFVNFVVMCLAGQLLNQTHTNLRLLTAPLPDQNGKDKKQRQPWKHQALLPIRVILRDFAARGIPRRTHKATVNHLWEFLYHELKHARLEAYAASLEEHLRVYGGLVLFDGLDEVPEAEQRRAQIKQVVEEFARSFPRCRILVTSRTYAYQQQEWRLSGFREAVLAAFTRGQVIRFIERWYSHSAEVRGMNAENARGQAEILKRSIDQNPRLYNLAQRPLLLTLMASLHYWRGGSLPEKREELYNDAVDLLLDWWESSRVVRDADGGMVIVQPSLTEFLNVGKEGVQTALSFLAFQAHARQSELTGSADIAESDLLRELMQVSPNQDLRPARLIEYLRDRAGLLMPRGVGVYAFPHRTFQEYLAACYLTDEDDYPYNIADLACQDPNRWREVVLLAGAKASRGAASTIWLLADALCEQDVHSEHLTPAHAWGALFAGHALVETARLKQLSRNQRKVERIRQWLAAILTERQPVHGPFPVVERALAGNILAQLGDPRPGVGLREDGLPDLEWCDVPAGSFLMGDDQKQVDVSAPYCLSRYPVTNAQYRAFIADEGYTERWRECWTDRGWEWREKKRITEPGWGRGEFDLPNHPVARVSWYEAVAFCEWLTHRLRARAELSVEQSVRLPTEAEWEKAVRGEGGREYPWGDENITPEHGNYDETGLGATSTVGCFPRGVSPYGCEEMAGNVWEWCEGDWLSGSGRVLRGGSWGNIAWNCGSACRYRLDPSDRDLNLGFRLLRTPS